MTRVAINGLGRIGRAALKQVLDEPALELVALNDLAPADNLAYLLKYDTVYGRYGRDVACEEGHLVIGGTHYPLFSESDPARLSWREKRVDVVLECTGAFTSREGLSKHLEAGARHAILSAPSKAAEVLPVVSGVNTPQQRPQVISCASCTTNCIAPVVEVLNRGIGVRKAAMTTVHAYTSSQSIVDAPAKRVERGRSGAANLVPTSTGAAKATARVLPELEGIFDGAAIRAPVAIGSIADITFLTSRATSVDEINQLFVDESGSERYREILGVSHDPMVSSDIIGDPRASVVDLTRTQVIDGDLVKVMSWYDNEWGFTRQMIREVLAFAAQGG